MQIKWNSDTLCHGHDRGVGKATGPADLTIDEPGAVQVDHRIRNAQPTLFDRGNRPAIVGFSVTQEFASTAAAVIAYGTQARGLVNTGTLELIPGGSHKLVGTGSVLEVENRRLAGVAVIWRYRITCPKLETAAST